MYHRCWPRPIRASAGAPLVGPYAGSALCGGGGRTGEGGGPRATSGPAEGILGSAPMPSVGGPVSRADRSGARPPPGSAPAPGAGATASARAGARRSSLAGTVPPAGPRGAAGPPRCRSRHARAPSRRHAANSTRFLSPASSDPSPPWSNLRATRYAAPPSAESARSPEGGGAPARGGCFVDERQDSDVQRVGAGSPAPRKSLKRKDIGCHARLARLLH